MDTAVASLRLPQPQPSRGGVRAGGAADHDTYPEELLAAASSSRVEANLVAPLYTLERRFHEVSHALLNVDRIAAQHQHQQHQQHQQQQQQQRTTTATTTTTATASALSSADAKRVIQESIDALDRATEVCETAIQDTLNRLRLQVSALSEDNGVLSSRYPQLMKALSAWVGGPGARTPSLSANHPLPQQPQRRRSLGLAVAHSAPTACLGTPSRAECQSASANHSGAGAGARVNRGRDNSNPNGSLASVPPMRSQEATNYTAPQSVDGNAGGLGIFPRSPVATPTAATAAAAASAAAVAAVPQTRGALVAAARDANARVAELLTGGGACSTEVKAYLKAFVEWRGGRQRRRCHHAPYHRPSSASAASCSEAVSPSQTPAGGPHGAGAAGAVDRGGNDAVWHSFDISASSLTTSSFRTAKSDDFGRSDAHVPGEAAALLPAARRSLFNGSGSTAAAAPNGAAPVPPQPQPPADTAMIPKAPQVAGTTPATDPRGAAETGWGGDSPTRHTRRSLRATVDAMVLQQLQYDGVSLPPGLKEDLTPPGTAEEAQGTAHAADVAAVFSEIRKSVFHPTPCPAETLCAAAAAAAAAAVQQHRRQHAHNEEEGKEEKERHVPQDVGGHSGPIAVLLRHSCPAASAWLLDLMEVGAQALPVWLASVSAMRAAERRVEEQARDDAMRRAGDHPPGREKTHDAHRRTNEEEKEEADLSKDGSLSVAGGGSLDGPGFARAASTNSAGDNASSPLRRPAARSLDRSRSASYSMLAGLAGQQSEPSSDGGGGGTVMRRPQARLEGSNDIRDTGEQIMAEEEERLASEEEETAAFWDMNVTPPAYRSSPTAALFDDPASEEEEEEEEEDDDEEVEEVEEEEDEEEDDEDERADDEDDVDYVEAFEDEEEEADATYARALRLPRRQRQGLPDEQHERGEEEVEEGEGERNKKAAFTSWISDRIHHASEARRRKNLLARTKATQCFLLRNQIGMRAKAVLADLALLCVLQEITFAVARAEAEASSSSSLLSSPFFAAPSEPSQAESNAAAVKALKDAMQLIAFAQSDPILSHRTSTDSNNSNNNSNSNSNEGKEDGSHHVLLSFRHIVTAVGYLPLLLCDFGTGDGERSAAAMRSAQRFVACVAPYLTLWGARLLRGHRPAVEGAAGSPLERQRRIFPGEHGVNGGAPAGSPAGSPIGSPVLNAQWRSAAAGGPPSSALPFPTSLAPLVWQETVHASLAQQVYRLSQEVHLLRRLEGEGAVASTETLGQWKARVDRGAGAARPPPAYPENGLSRFVFPISETLLRELDLWNSGGLLPVPPGTNASRERAVDGGPKRRRRGSSSTSSTSSSTSSNTNSSSSSSSDSENAQILEDDLDTVAEGPSSGFALPPAEMAARVLSAEEVVEAVEERANAATSPSRSQLNDSATVRRGIWQALMPWARGLRASAAARSAGVMAAAGGRGPTAPAGSGSPSNDYSSSSNTAGDGAGDGKAPAPTAESTNALVLELPHAAAILAERDRALQSSGHEDFARVWRVRIPPPLADNVDEADGSDDNDNGNDGVLRFPKRRDRRRRQAAKDGALEPRVVICDTLYSTDPCLTSRPSSGVTVSCLPAFRTTMCYCLVSRRRCLDPLVSGALLRRFTKDGEPLTTAGALPSVTNAAAAGLASESQQIAALIRLVEGADGIDRRRFSLAAMAAVSGQEGSEIAGVVLPLRTGRRDTVEGRAHTRAEHIPPPHLPPAMLGTADWGYRRMPPPVMERAAAPAVYAQEPRNVHGTPRGVAQETEHGSNSRAAEARLNERPRREPHRHRRGGTGHDDDADQEEEADGTPREEQHAESLEDDEDHSLSRYVPATRLLTPNLYDTTSAVRSARLNPPDLLSCGHVISHKELQRTISTANARRLRGLSGAAPVQSVRCPYCQADCALTSILTLSYIY